MQNACRIDLKEWYLFRVNKGRGGGGMWVVIWVLPICSCAALCIAQRVLCSAATNPLMLQQSMQHTFECVSAYK